MPHHSLPEVRRRPRLLNLRMCLSIFLSILSNLSNLSIQQARTPAHPDIYSEHTPS